MNMNSIRTVIKKNPVIKQLLQYDLYPYIRHKFTLFTDKRENSTFTGFLRLPTQFEALTEECVKYILGANKTLKPKICIVGCSNGAEAYTISSVLQNNYPGLDFEIKAFDIDPVILSKAKTARYNTDEVLNNKMITDDFIGSTFDIEDNVYKVKQNISDRVFFMEGDVLDPNFIKSHAGFDFVFAQNFLFHLRRKDMKKAFYNICSLLNNRAVLFVAGMDLDLREKLSRKMNLHPLQYKIEAIHKEAQNARAIGWPYNYWGLEPFNASRGDWQRKYATIYFADN